MNLVTAIPILQALADGINPITGAPLTGETLYDDPRIISALTIAVRAIKARQLDRDCQNTRPAHSGKPWTVEEDEQLICEFEARIAIRDIAEKHRRTRGAILARLVRHGKLAPRYAPKRLEEAIVASTPSKWWKEQGRTQAGKAWTPEEDKALLKEFEAGLSIEQIAERRHRGVRSVEVRLIKLGKHRQ